MTHPRIPRHPSRDRKVIDWTEPEFDAPWRFDELALIAAGVGVAALLFLGVI